MKVACLSGKGGAGKTLVAVNLAAAVNGGSYIDCDVEEPNGRLFLKPTETRTEEVFVAEPRFDAETCIGCKACVSFCRFHALVYVKEKPMLFSEACHGCGGCALVCPTGAVTETQRRIGTIEIGRHGAIKIVTGILDTGEASGVPIIRRARREAEGFTVFDCPPGSACSVMESIAEADHCLLIAEPTAFGLHNLRMVQELVTLLDKPCSVVVNRQEEPYEPLERFCREKGLRVLARIPYDGRIAAAAADGLLVSETDPALCTLFLKLAQQLGGV